jgi:hypothetical protein
MIAAISGDISLPFLTDDVSFLMLQNYLNIFLVVTRECHMCMITSKKTVRGGTLGRAHMWGMLIH